MWLELAALLFSLGLTVTAAASALGLAGGAIISPLLILGLGIEPRLAVGTTILGVFAAVLSASVAYLRQGRVDIWLALLFDALDILGVALGAYMTIVLLPDVLALCMGAFLLYSGSRLALRVLRQWLRPPNNQGSGSPDQREAIWHRVVVDRGGEAFSYSLGRRGLAVAVVGSFFSGLVSGMLGLGGGVMDLSLMLLLGIPIEVAAPTAMFGMLLTRASSVVAHALLGNISLEFAAPLALGALIGGQIGPRLAKRIRPEALKLAFASIVLVLGSLLLYRSLTAILGALKLS